MAGERGERPGGKAQALEDGLGRHGRALAAPLAPPEVDFTPREPPSSVGAGERAAEHRSTGERAR